MRELLSELPDDAVEQVNAKIPLDKTGEPKYPENLTLNGYVNQILLKALEKMDKLAVSIFMKSFEINYVKAAHGACYPN